MSFLLIIAMANTAIVYAAIPTAPPPPAKMDYPVGPVSSNDFAPPPPGPNRDPIPRGLITQWVTPNDYPTRALVEKREGTTGFTLSITKWGTVSQCLVTKSSGHEDLDQSTCNSAAYKARFWPATDARGNPTEGRYSNNVRWQIPKENSGSAAIYPNAPSSNSSATSPPYFPRTLTKQFPMPPVMRGYFPWNLPTADSYPAQAWQEKRGGETEIALDITKEGSIASCNVINSSGHADLDAAACDFVKGRATFKHAYDVNGNPAAGRITTGVAWVVPPDANSGDLPSPVGLVRDNPFQHTGSALAEISIDAEGKLGACKVHSNSDQDLSKQGIFKELAKMESVICQNGSGMLGRLAPLKDANGNAIARKVILKLSLEHADFEAATAKPIEIVTKGRDALPHNNADLWITEADYPEPASRIEAESSVTYSLTISPDGRATKCEIVATSGNKALDDATCRSLLRRARFKPALDENGIPTTGSWVGSYEWKIPE